MQHVRSRFRIHELTTRPAAQGCPQPVTFTISPADADDILPADSRENAVEGKTMYLQATVPDIVACIQHFCQSCHLSVAGKRDGYPAGSSLVAPALIKSTIDLANAVAPNTELTILSAEQQPRQMAGEDGLQLQQLRQENTELRLQVEALKQEVGTLTDELELAEDSLLEAEAAAEDAAAEAAKSAVSAAGSEKDGGTDAPGISAASAMMTQLQEQLRHAEFRAVQESERCAELEIQCGKYHDPYLCCLQFWICQY